LLKKILVILFIFALPAGAADLKFANFATSTIANVGGIAAGDTSLAVAAGDGALFPALGANEYFYCVLADSAGNREVIKVTARATDTFTIERAEDGTSARAWDYGDIVSHRVTQGGLEDIQTLLESAVQNTGNEDVAGIKNFTDGITIDGVALARNPTFANNSNGNPNTSDTVLQVGAGSATAAQWSAIYPTAGTPVETYTYEKHTWAALDDVPTDADWIRVHVFVEGTDSTAAGNGEYYAGAYFRENGGQQAVGSDNLGPYAQTYILAGEYGNATDTGEYTVPVASACFDVRPVNTFDTDHIITIRLIGWGYNP
jgi:hypothetical protein